MRSDMLLSQPEGAGAGAGAEFTGAASAAMQPALRQAPPGFGAASSRSARDAQARAAALFHAQAAAARALRCVKTL